MRALSIILLPIVVGCTSPASGNQDDTYEALDRTHSAIRLTGDQGLRPYEYDGRSPATIDARKATFNASNSRNTNPTRTLPCKEGNQPTNPYPVSVQATPNVTLAGGLVRGRIPQNSDWQSSYCNSAAILFKRSAGGVVDGVRITGAWDAVRASSQSAGLTLANSWISNVRDDFFENDYLYPATIRDTLVDGTFQGVSLKPGSDSKLADASANVVTMSGLLIRIREYPYKGEMRYGALTKNDIRSPRLTIRNSIVAVDYRGGKTFPDYWSRTWAKLTGSSNNVFLWLSDDPIPATFPRPPASFRVVTGRAARQLWASARDNWINCHPRLAREPNEPRSIAAACRRDTWGGRGD